MKTFHVRPLYDIRWRLEYLNGIAPKWGQWTRPEREIMKMGSFQNREYISRAFVEVRDKRTFQTRQPVSCKGWDFVIFQWEYAASIAGGMGIKNHTPISQVTGIKLVTRDFETIVRVDGSPILTRRRTDKERNTNFACFGK